MAKNEIYKFGKWLSFPLPLRGNNAALNADPTLPGDPVKIGSAVGFAQEVGGKPVSWPDADTGGNSIVSWSISTNTANSLEPGWASVALVGAFAFPVTNWDPTLMGSGTPVGIVKAVGSTRARLVANAVSDGWFGYIVGQTMNPMLDPVSGLPLANGAMIPIVNIVQTVSGTANTVPDKTATGS